MSCLPQQAFYIGTHLYTAIWTEVAVGRCRPCRISVLLVATPEFAMLVSRRSPEPWAVQHSSEKPHKYKKGKEEMVKKKAERKASSIPRLVLDVSSLWQDACV